MSYCPRSPPSRPNPGRRVHRGIDERAGRGLQLRGQAAGDQPDDRPGRGPQRPAPADQPGHRRRCADRHPGDGRVRHRRLPRGRARPGAAAVGRGAGGRLRRPLRGRRRPAAPGAEPGVGAAGRRRPERPGAARRARRAAARPADRHPGRAGRAAAAGPVDRGPVDGVRGAVRGGHPAAAGHAAGRGARADLGRARRRPGGAGHRARRGALAAEPGPPLPAAGQRRGPAAAAPGPARWRCPARCSTCCRRGRRSRCRRSRRGRPGARAARRAGHLRRGAGRAPAAGRASWCCATGWRRSPS